ncbi:hypothetical protein A3195_02075 [Candidatus Thiodiazotropha endoloripes]|uniref:Uncharacterized protein n=2 Tax=Candidatus Thiodiazotropha endoloripes TaxID=1818881 RepID=A0A1E2UP51_9GAMM|nr:hypothetical protein A3193_18380 [Candidatus Thiodiazotropha endoloripes]ODB90302.1 hypothetical protein A3195_02075 [Candidatus Thiodiazotropha endoloripes]ODB95002.1 hypothetical protein A3194_20275 [Candidatus Thiodiazotropha endoloripes]ODB96431.1 hypothetical protein A3196_06455 [Candidatus Thiodiazotropha endoloripes]
MHFLLTWYLGDRLWRYLTESSSYHQPAMIRITIESPIRTSTPHENHQQVSMPKQQRSPTQTAEPKHHDKPPSPTNQAELNERQQPITETTADKITSARILSSSKEISRNLVIDEEQADTIENKNSVSATLDQALNPKREAPNLSTRADGTIRVVTEQGYTYCIKPLDDWRIVDPQDDMRVSAFCK